MRDEDSIELGEAVFAQKWGTSFPAPFFFLRFPLCFLCSWHRLFSWKEIKRSANHILLLHILYTVTYEWC